MSDGGWLFVKSLFWPREIKALSLPGIGPDGLHRISVTFADGETANTWKARAEAAEAEAVRLRGVVELVLQEAVPGHEFTTYRGDFIIREVVLNKLRAALTPPSEGE